MACQRKLEEIIGKLPEAVVVFGKAVRWRMPVAGSASPIRPIFAGARSGRDQNEQS